jgi:hypothetical protein
MKSFRLSYLIGLFFVFDLILVNAQIDYEQIRNTDTISYYVNNPYGTMAEFTWIISGGTIVGHSTPYTAAGADNILVIWNDSNRTTPNFSYLRISETINWPDGASCQSDEEQIDVESWVQAKASTDTSGIRVCRGESLVIKVEFEGKPGYQYKWKLYEKENPEILVEDHTSDFENSINPSIDILIAGIENNSNTQKIYEFLVTEVRDGLNDDMPGDVSMASATIYVQPVPLIGEIKSSNNLIRR